MSVPAVLAEMVVPVQIESTDTLVTVNQDTLDTTVKQVHGTRTIVYDTEWYISVHLYTLCVDISVNILILQQDNYNNLFIMYSDRKSFILAPCGCMSLDW